MFISFPICSIIGKSYEGLADIEKYYENPNKPKQKNTLTGKIWKDSIN